MPGSGAITRGYGVIRKFTSLAAKVLNARQRNESWPAFARRLWKLRRRMVRSGRSKITSRDIAAVSRLLRSGRIAYGPEVRAFQADFAKRLGARRAVACTSGTSAIHVALAMLNIEPGDEVIVPPITDMGSILPILAQNAIPIFADVDARTWTIDPACVEAAVTPRTRAVIAVHLFGNPCDMDALMALGAKHGFAVIEDCAQAHLASYRDRPVGTVGHAGTFSLQWTKHITTCEGGIVVTDDPVMAERGRLFVDKGWNRGAGAGARQYPLFGLNYRMSEMQAALGRSQLKRLKSLIESRRRNAEQFIAALSSVPGLAFQHIHDGCRSAYWQIAATVEPDAPYTADSLAAVLGRARIPAAAHYIGRPIHLCHHPLLERRIYGTSDLPFSLSDRGSSLDYRQMAMPVAQDVLNRLVIFAIPNEHFDAKQIEELSEEVKEILEDLSNPARMQKKPAARYKIGVVGCGKIAQEHLENIARIDAVKVTAIADVNETALKNIGSRFGVAAQYADYHAMLREEELDLLLVLTWPTLHADVVVAAAEQGVRAILCEKPIASSLGEARAMLDAVERAGALLVIGHQHRFNPHLEEARRLIASGEIGTVRHVWTHCRSSLINNGSHVIDGLLYMLSDPKVQWVLGQVHCTKKQIDRGQPVEDGSVGLICLENDVRVNIEMGDTAVPDIAWHFYGDAGKIDVSVTGLEYVGRTARRPKRVQRSAGGSMERQVLEILDCLEKRKTEHRGSAARGYRALETLIGLLESARLDAVIAMPVAQMRYPLDLIETSPKGTPSESTT